VGLTSPTNALICAQTLCALLLVPDEALIDPLSHSRRVVCLLGLMPWLAMHTAPGILSNSSCFARKNKKYTLIDENINFKKNDFRNC